MRDVLGPGTVLGYCTNVHAGATWDETRASLARYAPAIRRRVAPDGALGVGLWLSASGARTLAGDPGPLRDVLREHGLLAYTINGFPYGDFHRTVVKHRVYAPDWTDPRRSAYTLDLVSILRRLLPSGAEGSISTLPLGWPGGGADDGRRRAAASNLRALAVHLARTEAESGRCIHVDLEPEPGCLLARSAEVVAFFEGGLLAGASPGEADAVRRHLRVCHDVCHAAVMGEDQADALGRYAAHGIAVGKVQISNAPRVDLRGLDAAGARRALHELAAFGEDRYLHQTTVRTAGGRRFFDDLPAALAAAAADDELAAGEWCVHYHVPVYLERLGALGTARDEIGRCLSCPSVRDGVRHYEVETYAWDVLPEAHRPEDLADGIARELTWVRDLAGAMTG